MKKLSDVKKAGKARAEYIKVEPNIRLHITDAGKGWALAMFVLIFIVVSACNKTSELTGDALRPASFTDKQWLGKQLFFDTNLSEPAGQACVACHAPQVGWTGPEYAANMTSEVGNLGLTTTEEEAIVAFLKTLTDR